MKPPLSQAPSRVGYPTVPPRLARDLGALQMLTQPHRSARLRLGQTLGPDLAALLINNVATPSR